MQTDSIACQNGCGVLAWCDSNGAACLTCGATYRRNAPKRRPVNPQLTRRREDTVPAFSPDGMRRRNYSLAQAERLCAASFAVAKRNRKGKILAIEFLPSEGETAAARESAHGGTKYSFLRRISDTTRLWELDLSILGAEVTA